MNLEKLFLSVTRITIRYRARNKMSKKTKLIQFEGLLIKNCVSRLNQFNLSKFIFSNGCDAIFRMFCMFFFSCFACFRMFFACFCMFLHVFCMFFACFCMFVRAVRWCRFDLLCVSKWKVLEMQAYVDIGSTKMTIVMSIMDWLINRMFCGVRRLRFLK